MVVPLGGKNTMFCYFQGNFWWIPQSVNIFLSISFFWQIHIHYLTSSFLVLELPRKKHTKYEIWKKRIRQYTHNLKSRIIDMYRILSKNVRTLIKSAVKISQYISNSSNYRPLCNKVHNHSIEYLKKAKLRKMGSKRALNWKK